MIGGCMIDHTDVHATCRTNEAMVQLAQIFAGREYWYYVPKVSLNSILSSTMGI